VTSTSPRRREVMTRPALPRNCGPDRCTGSLGIVVRADKGSDPQPSGAPARSAAIKEVTLVGSLDITSVRIAEAKAAFKTRYRFGERIGVLEPGADHLVTDIDVSYFDGNTFLGNGDGEEWWFSRIQVYGNLPFCQKLVDVLNTHDARVTELLTTNNEYLQRARDAEAKLRAAQPPAVTPEEKAILRLYRAEFDSVRLEPTEARQSLIDRGWLVWVPAWPSGSAWALTPLGWQTHNDLFPRILIDPVDLLPIKAGIPYRDLALAAVCSFVGAGSGAVLAVLAMAWGWL
jgi:hypothetical protein